MRTVLFTVHMRHSIAAFARRDFYLNVDEHSIFSFLIMIIHSSLGGDY